MSREHRGQRSPEMDVKYKKLSRINGTINKMNTFQIEKELERLKLENSGNREVLKKRLKNYHRRQMLGGTAGGDSQIMFKPFFTCFCVIDFEATCMEKNEEGFHHEIIEFPAVIVCIAERKVVSEFHSYCRPVVNPELTEFCRELTGISQEQVNEAPLFSLVLSRFLLWLQEHEILHKCKVGLVTHGAWDFGKFMFLQCLADKTEFPARVKKWINIKKTFSNFYKCKKVSLEDMLSQQGLTFEGRLHSGLDDAKNIARVLIGMLQDGATFRLNERILITRNKDGERQAKILPITRLQCLRQGILPANQQRRTNTIEYDEAFSDEDAALAAEADDVTSDDDVTYRPRTPRDGDRFERVARPRTPTSGMVRPRTPTNGSERNTNRPSPIMERNIQNGVHASQEHVNHRSTGRYQDNRPRYETNRSNESHSSSESHRYRSNESRRFTDTDSHNYRSSESRRYADSDSYNASQQSYTSRPQERSQRNQPSSSSQRYNRDNQSSSNRHEDRRYRNNFDVNVTLVEARNTGRCSDRGAWDDRSGNVSSMRRGNEPPAYSRKEFIASNTT